MQVLEERNHSSRTEPLTYTTPSPRPSSLVSRSERIDGGQVRRPDLVRERRVHLPTPQPLLRVPRTTDRPLSLNMSEYPPAWSAQSAGTREGGGVGPSREEPRAGRQASPQWPEQSGAGRQGLAWELDSCQVSPAGSPGRKSSRPLGLDGVLDRLYSLALAPGSMASAFVRQEGSILAEGR